MTPEVTIHHRGRTSQALIQGGDAQLKKLRNALLLNNFIVARESSERLELRRRAYVTQDDWPMRVIVQRNGNQFDIRYFLCIPWGWIASFVFLMWLVLPFAGVPNAALAFGLAAVVAAVAIYRQKFDCRPNARYWQQQPRQRWGKIMEQIIQEAFARR